MESPQIEEINLDEIGVEDDITSVGTLDEDEEDDAASLDGGVSEDEDEDASLGVISGDEDTAASLDGVISEDEDEGGEDDTGISEDAHLQKLNTTNINNYVETIYPEYISQNIDEINTLATLVRNESGEIIDDYHKTLPFITRFEKAKLLGLRTSQLSQDPTQATVTVNPGIIDSYKIALEEYKQKKIPYIIRRPLPDGTCEYWKFSDLEQIE
jgi:DNA-directed RNA polymerase subunit K/omega